jgi:hypothetical protein
MTITLNRNVLLFVLVLVVLGVGGYLVGTRMNGSSAVATDPSSVQPAASDLAAGVPTFAMPTAVPDTAPRVAMDAFKAAFDAGEDMVIIDVRLPDAYAAGHIVGAINIPESETTVRLAEIPKDRRIVLYCA